MKIDPKYLDYAKSGLFMAIGAATDDAGNKLQIEVADDDLTRAADLAIDHLVSVVFGPDVYLKRMRHERRLQG